MSADYMQGHADGYHEGLHAGRARTKPTESDRDAELRAVDMWVSTDFD